MAKGSWSLGLVKSMNDPANQIISSRLGIVIKDKNPKAKHHYLVLPKDDIPDIYHLNESHLDLLSELHLLAISVIEVMNCRNEDFKIGFHVQPSMQPLHIHVISNDFVSACLKTKKHWNSFNTRLFLPYCELVDGLKKHGAVQKMNKDVIEELKLTELKCNQCDQKSKTIPDLKKHLLSHLNN